LNKNTVFQLHLNQVCILTGHWSDLRNENNASFHVRKFVKILLDSVTLISDFLAINSPSCKMNNLYFRAEHKLTTSLS